LKQLSLPSLLVSFARFFRYELSGGLFAYLCFEDCVLLYQSPRPVAHILQNFLNVNFLFFHYSPLSIAISL